MIKVTFIAYEQCALSGILGLMDAFIIANLWNFKIKEDNRIIDSDASFKEPLFVTAIVSANGNQVNANEDISTFRRLFKKHTALSPKEYRTRFVTYITNRYNGK